MIQLIIDLIAILAWPAVVLTISRFVIKYIDDLLKLRKPMSDIYYQELRAEIKTLRAEINSHRIQRGMDND